MEEKVVFRDAEDDQHYAKVTQSLGSGRFVLHMVVNRTDGQPPLLDTTVNYMGILPGRMKKQKWKNFVAPNDYVLISKREFQAEDNKKVDIVMKYSTEAVRKLSKINEIPKGDDEGEDSLFIGEDDAEQQSQASSGGSGSSSTGKKKGGVATIAEEESDNKDWKVDFDDI